MGLFELNLDLLHYSEVVQAQDISKYPKVRRDVAIVVDKALSFADIREKILDCNSQYLKNIELFDVYCGEEIPEQKKSLAIALWFQAFDYTLTDDMVVAEINDLLEFLNNSFNIVVREY